MTTLTTGPTVRDVDAAVRSVLAGLLAPSGRNGSIRPSTNQDSDVFAGRLLSLRHAEMLKPGRRVVKVSPETIITPLAKDLLKRLGVEVRLIARDELNRVRNAGEWAFAIERETGLVEAFRRALLDGTDAWHELGASVDDVTDWVAAGEARGALLLADEASMAVYRGCQVPGVRAASVEEPGAVVRAVRAIGVNLLVVEPPGKSISLLKQIGATFRRSGGPRMPEWAAHERGRVFG